MPAALLAVAAREPRRARYLIPRDLPRRGEIIAALWALTLVGHLLLAQLTILLAVAFQVISRVSRWRPQWLAVPAAAGFLWALAIGPAAALAGFADGPRRVLGYLAKTARDPANIVHLGTVFGGLGHWLPRQLPLALIVAAGEAAAAWWLRWLHTDQQDFPAPRPGLMVLVGRQLRSRSVAAGGVVTREGAWLGIVARTGEQAAISWPEAERGVLCTGSSGAAVAATSFQVIHAAIRRRACPLGRAGNGDDRLGRRRGSCEAHLRRLPQLLVRSCCRSARRSGRPGHRRPRPPAQPAGAAGPGGAGAPLPSAPRAAGRAGQGVREPDAGRSFRCRGPHRTTDRAACVSPWPVAAPGVAGGPVRHLRADQPERDRQGPGGGAPLAGPGALRPGRRDDREPGRARHSGGFRRVPPASGRRRRARLVQRLRGGRPPGARRPARRRRPGRAGRAARHGVTGGRGAGCRARECSRHPPAGRCRAGRSAEHT